jgi:predicted metalloprotease
MTAHLFPPGFCTTQLRLLRHAELPADQTIVMPIDSMRSIARYGEGYALAVLSHEYGHHLQQQTGVMDAFQARGQAIGYASRAGQLLSRQLELQAWCFSGTFYGTNTGHGSITRSLSQQAYDSNSHAGDRRGERGCTASTRTSRTGSGGAGTPPWAPQPGSRRARMHF